MIWKLCISTLAILSLNVRGAAAQPASFTGNQVTVVFNALPMSQAIQVLSDSAGVGFSYQGGLWPDQQKITLKAYQQPFEQVLKQMLTGTDVTFLKLNGQVVLKKRQPPTMRYVLSGIVLEADTEEPVSYATLQAKGTLRGTVADHQGQFSLELNAEQLSDTLIFNAMGYTGTSILAKDLIHQGNHRIFLSTETVTLPAVEVTSYRFAPVKVGHWCKRASKSVYMDTHGQQTALYIPNPNKEEPAMLGKVWYYLAKEGNTEAPFRVRVYAKDPQTGGPGEDLLKAFVVAKPNHQHGWYAVELVQYDIDMPADGCFVAMEGVFPNDYSFYETEATYEGAGRPGKKAGRGFSSRALHYGQRLGYRKKRKNNTWHYALSQTWFQLGKRSFNVLIAAELWVPEMGKTNKKHQR